MTASRPRTSCLSTAAWPLSQIRFTMSVWPSREASMRAVWWSSLRDMLPFSWPRERRSWTMVVWPRWLARWRDVLESPLGVQSGLWRREGCDFRMRAQRRGSLAWMARRRRREGSILRGVLGEGECEDGERGGGTCIVRALLERLRIEWQLPL